MISNNETKRFIVTVYFRPIKELETRSNYDTEINGTVDYNKIIASCSEPENEWCFRP